MGRVPNFPEQHIIRFRRDVWWYNHDAAAHSLGQVLLPVDWYDLDDSPQNVDPVDWYHLNDSLQDVDPMDLHLAKLTKGQAIKSVKAVPSVVNSWILDGLCGLSARRRKRQS